MATFNVTNLADSGVGSLREAIFIAESTTEADEINFDSALSGGTINLTSGRLDVRANLSINGLGSNLLTIDAGGLSSVFAVSASQADISGLTITGGYSSSIGGGVIVGILSSLNLTNTVISGNSADFGGGGIAVAESDVTITNSIISNNSATSFGGGIYHRFGNLDISNSTISGNSSSFYGGGLYLERMRYSFNNTVIAGNSARFNSDLFLDRAVPEGDTTLGGILAVAIVGFTYFRKRQRHKTVQKLQKKGVLTTPQI
jgi:hypothetical protein